MSTLSWSDLARRSLAGEVPSRDDCTRGPDAPPDDLLALLDAAFRCAATTGAAASRCTCSRTPSSARVPRTAASARSRASTQSPGGEAPMKSVDELVDGARRAHAARAKRYCMVTATRGPSQRDLDTICEAAERIKAEMDIELCASLGILTEAKAQAAREAGRRSLQPQPRDQRAPLRRRSSSTHTWRDRVETVRIAKAAGMDTCCGGIVGLGETEDDLLDLAFALRELDVDSVPVNFLDAAPGHAARGLPARRARLRAARAVHVPLRPPAHRPARRRRPRGHAARDAGDARCTRRTRSSRRAT